jgi:hypothetical protein
MSANVSNSVRYRVRASGTGDQFGPANFIRTSNRSKISNSSKNNRFCNRQVDGNVPDTSSTAILSPLMDTLNIGKDGICTR